MNSAAKDLWVLFESQKESGLISEMRKTLHKLDKEGYRDAFWLNAMGEIASLEQNYRQAIRFFEQAVKLSEKPEFKLNLGNAHYFLGDYESSIRILTEHLTHHPKDAHAHLNLVNCFLKQSRYNEAQSMCDKGLELGLNPSPFWNAMGQIQFLMGNFPDAYTLFEQAYENSPDFVDALFNRANCLCKLGRIPEAIDDYLKCTRKDENYEVAWQNRTIACLDSGEFDKALESAEMAMRLNGKSIDNRCLMARVRLARNELRLAREHLKESLRLQSDHVPSLIAMARVCSLEEEKEAACDWAKRIIVRAPFPSEEAVWALGLLVEMEQYEVGLHAILRAHNSVKHGKGALLKVVCLWKVGKIREAISEMEALLKIQGEDTAEAFTLLGLLLLETGADSLAESRLQMALEKQPGQVRATQELTRLLMKRGDADGAVLKLRQALEDNPNHPELLFHLASCQSHQGQLEEAWVLLRRAVDFGFKDAHRMMDDVNLKPLRNVHEFAPLMNG